MIIISNRQRDDILRYIDLMCEALQGQDTRTYNTKRLARNLAARLKAKQQFSASDLPAQSEFLAKESDYDIIAVNLLQPKNR